MMDTLRLVDKRVEKHTELYEIVSDTPSDPRLPKVERYIASTPQTRRVCTQSELIDFVLRGEDYKSSQFREVLSESIVNVMLNTKLRDMLTSTWGNIRKEDGRRRYIDMFKILRGGLNFDPSEAIWQLGYTAKTQKIMLQRFKTDAAGNGWATFSAETNKIFEKERPEHVRELHFVPGDIIASGASSLDGLMKLLGRIGEKHQEFADVYHNPDAHYTVGSFTFFTIGSINAERSINEVLSRYAHTGVLSPNFVARIIYLEGRFGVASRGTDIPFQKNGTDLYPCIGEGAIPSPSFMLNWLSKPYYPLEACAIYDGGSRRCDPEFALEDVIHHFRTMREYAVEHNETLYEALRKRVPMLDTDSVETWRDAMPAWRDKDAVPDELIAGLIRRKNMTLEGYEDTHEALLRVYDERLEQLEQLR